MKTKLIAAVCLLSFFGAAALAAEDKADKPDDAPKLVAKLTLKKASFALDPAQQGEEFRKRLMAARDGRELPDPPSIDGTLSLTNSGKEPITIMVGADTSMIMLELKGPGAVSVNAQRAFTREFRLGKAVRIEAGGKHEFALPKLEFGFRGVANRAYWTEPGDYTLQARYTAAIEGAEKPVTIQAAAIKIKVAAK